MKLEKILTLNEANAGDIIGKIKNKYAKEIKIGNSTYTIDQVLKEYDPNQHDIHNVSLFPDKPIEVPADDWTEENQKMKKDYVKINRVSTPQQRLIVKRHVAFLTGNPIAFICNPQSDKEKALLAGLKRVNENVKMRYLNTEIGELMCSETHCAELWYVVDTSVTNPDQDDFEGIAINTRGLSLRCKILAHSYGDELYPVFDNMGDMVAFMRVYKDTDDDDNAIEVTEIYTAAVTYIIQKSENSAGYNVERKENLIGKIPVIYYSQKVPEWADVRSNIKRYEIMLSRTGDSNDYYASPTTVVSGQIKNFSKKGETGKLLELEENAKVSLLEARNGVESIKFEKETLKSEILEGSQTPDISFESMKSLGTFSGIALKMLFFDASLKVKGKLPTYGMSKQRSVNFIKAALSVFDKSFKEAALMPIEPKIEAYMPQNTEEMVTLLSLAVGGEAIMSQETAMVSNPLVENPEEEKAKLKSDTDNKLGQGALVQ